MKLWCAIYAVAEGRKVRIVEDDFYLPQAHDVRRHLRSRGHWPIRIKERRKPLVEWFDIRSGAWALQLLRALRFQTATASAGTALLNIIEHETDPMRRIAFLPTRAVLKGGGNFAEALRQLHLFDAATLAIIIAGETASDLKGVLPQAIEHVEEKRRQLRFVLTALGWLAFDIFSVVSSVVGVQWQFIPYLRKKGIESTDSEAIAKFTTALHRAEIFNGIMMGLCFIGLAGGALAVCSYLRNRDNPDSFMHRIVRRLPLFGSYLVHISLADGARLLARLLRGHVPLSDALGILAGAAIDPMVAGYWRACQKRLLAGSPPARALAKPLLLRGEQDQILTIETNAQLAEVMDAIAEERKIISRADQRKLVIAGMALLMTVSAAVVLTMVYLIMIQNQGFLDSIKNMRGNI